MTETIYQTLIVREYAREEITELGPKNGIGIKEISERKEMKRKQKIQDRRTVKPPADSSEDSMLTITERVERRKRRLERNGENYRKEEETGFLINDS